MAIFRSFNDLVIAFIDYLRLVQPDLDTKPGTVARDLFIDSPSQQMAELYSQLRNIANLQSFFSVSGTDLNRLASNFGVTRKTGTASSGVAVFTTNNLDYDILIPAASVIIANNGISFQVTNNTVMNSSSANVYKATATRLRTELDLATITDQYAIEIAVEAMTAGTSGNIGIYSLQTHNITGISNVTNLQSFSGGSNPESDDAFRTRILSVFAGANTGTALGYTTAIEAVDGVNDSIVIVSGDPLMTRDGTQVTTNSSGELVVSSAGSGGKVDIYMLGSALQSQVDSFIFNDNSGKNDPTDPINDFILGQRGEDTTLNSSQRRVSLIGANNLPFQPVSGVVSIAGSLSGSNFTEKYTDSAGITHGNYELIKDTGDLAGSPFGFDKIHWISNEIELSGEEVNKGTFNGADQLAFTDISAVASITQDVLITNENSISSSTKRNNIILKNTPIRSVNRVTNITTGERYIIEDQNPDGTSGEVNTTGRIIISGNTLPITTDVLQVDYVWVKSFDKVFDFDNLEDYNKNRTAQDSVDWSFGNLVVNEPAVVQEIDGELIIDISHPIYKIISIYSYSSNTAAVNSGVITVDSVANNVIDIRRVLDNAELYNTDTRDGTLSGAESIILPSDTIAVTGDTAYVRFNAVDVFNQGSESGIFYEKRITLLPGAALVGTQVLVTYVADVSTLLPENNLSNLPATKDVNSFLISEIITGEQPTSNLFDLGGNVTNNLRKASSNLRVITNSIVANGTLGILGTTMHKVTDALVVVTPGNGFDINLQASLEEEIGSTPISSYISVAKLYSVERVNVDKLGNVTSIDHIYDTINYKIKDNSYDIDVALKDTSLSSMYISLPQTPGNKKAALNTGDIVRITYYYINKNSSELLYFSRNGEQITNKVFADITKVYINSGFKGASGNLDGTVTIYNFNQPINNTSYTAGYNYMSPKENERITVTFNFNSLVGTSVFAIEDVRPITADVLVKEAVSKSINVSIRIVLLPEYQTQEQTVLQDAVDAVTTLLSATSLGTIVDASDVVNTLYTVSGIDRVKILDFSNEDSGNVLSIEAKKNEYLVAGTVDIKVETR